MNSMLSCPYCTDLHTNLGRVAGLESSNSLNSCSGSIKVVEKLLASDPTLLSISKYSLAFHTSSGPPSTTFANDLVEGVGSGARADAVTSLCWFIRWGGHGGNTLNDFYRRLGRGDVMNKQFVFGAAFAIWYTPLFAIIVGVSKLLSIFPSGSPKPVSQLLGVVLGTVASAWIVPVGILGALFS
ncbi:hypothetical protein TrCOL_g1178 [Triparma columacea]|uniref:Uncharacterized protein n=1 Tax=Triparma columacea TaxID=722753 RepID=A0A9W7GMA2_9STRA|nr:hypothetical protein TrCOL_g1178 [Triparma columacea]